MRESEPLQASANISSPPSVGEGIKVRGSALKHATLLRGLAGRETGLGKSEGRKPPHPEWVREWRCRHSLPVVAMESILHIYRRVSFSLRATPAHDANPHCGLRFRTE